MSLLTDQDRLDIWLACKSLGHRDFCQEYGAAIEAAVIAKLATVSVKPCAWEVQRAMAEPHLSYSKTKGALSNEPLYQAKALAAARVQALEEFKADLADALCADCENGVKYLNEQAAEKFRKDYPTVSALIGGKDV